MQRRRAPVAKIASVAFNCYQPLLELGRTDESLALLQRCRHDFQRESDLQGLGMTMIALSEVENRRGHGDDAIALARDGLRYLYMAADLTSIPAGYDVLGSYLLEHARQPVPALACHLAAALLTELAGAAHSDGPVSAAAAIVRQRGSILLPLDPDELCCQVGDVPGTDLPGLITQLGPDPEVARQALREIIARVQARVAATADSPDLSG